MSKDSALIRFLYANCLGRALLWFILRSGVLTLTEKFLCTGLSRPLIGLYIRKNRIDMRDYEGYTYLTFRDFFARRRNEKEMDMSDGHLISPCDGMLSAYSICAGRFYPVKGSYYQICDLVDDEAMELLFRDGVCLIFRLRATDYHHFCYIDNGFHYTNHFIQGTLHSIQPAACERVPVYRLNRRMWTLMDTEHFGKVIQIGVGAFLVGGIVHEGACCYFRRGEEMGHFELAGSTIVMLFQKDSICLTETIRHIMAAGREVEVHMGEMIGTTGHCVS